MKIFSFFFSFLLTLTDSKMDKNNFIGCFSGNGENQDPSNGEDVSRVVTPDLSVASDVNMTNSKPVDEDLLLDDTSNITLVNSDYFNDSDGTRDTDPENAAPKANANANNLIVPNLGAIPKNTPNKFFNFSDSFPTLLTPKSVQSSSSSRRERMRRFVSESNIESAAKTNNVVLMY